MEVSPEADMNSTLYFDTVVTFQRSDWPMRVISELVLYSPLTMD